MRRIALVCSIVIVLAAPAPALAQQPAPVPTPVQSTLTLSVERVGGKLATVLVGDRIRVRGSVGAFVPGQGVTVRFYSGRSKMLAKTKTLQAAPDGRGQFELSYRAQRSGSLQVRAFHDATAALGGLAAKSRTVDVLPRKVGSRSTRRAILALQRRLSRLGYVVGSRGAFDARTARAVLAFRKVTGMTRTTAASKPLMRAIAKGRGALEIRRPDQGRHIEADLTRQVIALIEGGKVRRIYPTSSGAPSTPTVVGTFRVYSKTPGTNAKGMVDSAYFIRGYATHGFSSVPIYPASHGCLRVPIPDARSLFNWIRIGTPVVVYHGRRPK